MAEINRRLNIVDEVTNGDITVYVHSTPIRREIFDQHYLLLTKTINRMYDESITPVMGARIAQRLIRDVATEMGASVREKLDTLLFPEIWRLTNVLVPEPERGGWTTLPFEKAVKDGLVDEDDADAVRNHLVFFTAASWVHTRRELKDLIYPMMTAALGSQIVSSSCTDFKDSCRHRRRSRVLARRRHLRPCHPRVGHDRRIPADVQPGGRVPLSLGRRVPRPPHPGERRKDVTPCL